ncbi:cell division protein FtsQ/DivIB [Blautia sp. MSJ-19]|uniref:cell division protein FtsQ/DivIB n=1 Tax=Blautia sp. MSJ-19 TaxID=2841517 RepID=UPI001C0EA818|nr:cell division protein FtsQ/DivIB [Blautia sp. MSJ-19]MBU5480429.1 cell division protein FtsQ/DivIB [Blautia sp. MSJ-19]
MRTSNYRKFKITKQTIRTILGAAAVAVLAGIIFFFAYFHVTKVEVMESTHYSSDELKEMILTGTFSSNSILAPLTCSRDHVEDIPYIEGYSVSRSGRNSIVISVREKNIVGCIPYLDNYIYFDRSGIFVEGDKNRDETVPFFDGIEVRKVIMNEKLPIKDSVLNTAVALSTIFAKNDMTPDHIELEEDSTIDLVYGDITVKLGKDKYLEDKMNRAIAILPQIAGEKGVLHMENITEISKTVTFEKEEEEVTAENWTGGYDENGEYTGDGEYDANGKYVGAKPMTALDYAVQNWIGGYDEDGDYTGSGEYDADMNYVGPAPTQDLIDSFGDWNGGYNESGGFDGVSEYDREGNYVGPMPGSEGADSSEDTSDESDESTDEETDSYSDYNDYSDEYSEDWGQDNYDEEYYE